MTTTSPTTDDIFHALAARARSTSDGRLVLAVIGGLAAAIGMAVWRPFGWMVLAGVCVCAAAFGAWGIADRELAEHESTRTCSHVVLHVVRVVSVVVGTCAAILAVLAMLRGAFGTWIS